MGNAVDWFNEIWLMESTGLCNPAGPWSHVGPSAFVAGFLHFYARWSLFPQVKQSCFRAHCSQVHPFPSVFQFLHTDA